MRVMVDSKLCGRYSYNDSATKLWYKLLSFSFVSLLVAFSSSALWGVEDDKTIQNNQQLAALSVKTPTLEGRSQRVFLRPFIPHVISSLAG